VRKLRAQEIVLATDDRRGLPVHQLLECKLAGIRIVDYLDFCERETGRVDLDALRPSWFIFSDGFRTGPVTDFTKRSFDCAVSVVMLILVLPILLLTALAIKLESVGPILYRQERVGLHGRQFILLKFRSMRVDAERDGMPQWARKRDPRVTRVGAWIRLLRIDELPQLVNVLKGDMSFVGPRPERPLFVEQIAREVPFYLERHSVKPGVTGWAQINYPYGASIEDARQKLSYDLYYLKNRGVFLDLVVLTQTVRVILWPTGAR
jgi:sugar transferase (PEP-CTERM system associated)